MDYAKAAKLGRAMNALYHLSEHGKRADEVLFLSRQGTEMPLDFQLLAELFEDAGWKTIAVCTNEFDSKAAFATGMLRTLKHLAKCRICITDGYNPCISMVDMKTEPLRQAPQAWVRYKEYPTEPLVIQLWHGLGAYKKFAWQAVGTPEGRTEADALAVRMHRNYSWVVCSGASNRHAFAEAFGYPVERVVPLALPSVGLLGKGRESAREALAPLYTGDPRSEDGMCDPGATRIVFAPTLRRCPAAAHPFVSLYERRDQLEHAIGAELLWSFHPLEDLPHIGSGSHDALETADIVVTDYSSIFYEAAAAGKAVVFYLPDIESYLISPGLNFDPRAVCPAIVRTDEQELIDYLHALVMREQPYDRAALDAAVGDTLDAADGNEPQLIFDFIMSKLR